MLVVELIVIFGAGIILIPAPVPKTSLEPAGYFFGSLLAL
jgi:hypothetical protein